MSKSNPDHGDGGHRQRIRRHYEPRISPNRPNYNILDWASAQSQRARFAIFLKHVSLAGKSLLDVGCGLGDLIGYIQEHNISADYTGVDILEKMVDAARQRHPEGRFVAGDVFQHSPFTPESFDVVFCSGAFNLNLGNNRQFLPAAVACLLGLAKETLVFNLLHQRSAAQEETYFYWDPADVRKMLNLSNCNVEIMDDYLHNDFTVICRKQIGK